MVCEFTKFIKGIVIKDNNPETIINGLHEAWCLNVGFPTVWFWEINGGEFKNGKMEELVNKLEIKIDYTSIFSLVEWSEWENSL